MIFYYLARHNSCTFVLVSMFSAPDPTYNISYGAMRFIFNMNYYNRYIYFQLAINYEIISAT